MAEQSNKIFSRSLPSLPPSIDTETSQTEIQSPIPSPAEFVENTPPPARSRRKSFVDIGSNPLSSSSNDVISNVLKIEVIADAVPIRDDQLEIIISHLYQAEDNSQLIEILNKEKLPYLFSSDQLQKILEVTPSVKTRITIFSLIGPRLTDPKAKSEYFIGLFRYSDEKLAVEEILKARTQTLASSVFSKVRSGSGPTNALSAGRGGRGPGPAGRGGRGLSRQQGSSTPIVSNTPFSSKVSLLPPPRTKNDHNLIQGETLYETSSLLMVKDNSTSNPRLILKESNPHTPIKEDKSSSTIDDLPAKSPIVEDDTDDDSNMLNITSFSPKKSTSEMFIPINSQTESKLDKFFTLDSNSNSPIDPTLNISHVSHPQNSSCPSSSSMVQLTSSVNSIILTTDLIGKCASVLKISREEFLHLTKEAPLESKTEVVNDSTEIKHYYSYKELVRRNYYKEYDGLIEGDLENYLTDNEFYLAFEKSRDDFYKQAKWKQIEQKKKAMLF